MAICHRVQAGIDNFKIDNECINTWVEITPTEALSILDISVDPTGTMTLADFDALLPVVLLTLSVAYGFRILKKLLMNQF